MSRPTRFASRRCPTLLAALALATSTLADEESAATAAAPAASRPKTLVLGLDGLDHALTQQLIADGRLPHLARLADDGSFVPLGTSFPPQSPVSWAVFNSGTNPGMFGVPGFVTRYFRRDAQGHATGTPLPKPMLGDATLLELPTPLPGLPREVPYEINPMQGTNWWEYLDAVGVRFMGLQLASVSPPDREGPHTQLLAGLGLKDISGSPGSWSVFTDDPWTIQNRTPSGGNVIKLYFDETAPDGREQARAELRGPRNWIQLAAWEAELERLEAAFARADRGTLEREAADTELATARDGFDAWKRDGEITSAAMLVRASDADRGAGRVEIEIDGRRVTLNVGQWTELLPVRFELTPDFSVHGVLRLQLLAANDAEVRLFAGPIQIDPQQPAPYQPLSAPPEFATELARQLGGPFETLGWAAPTNPYKDEVETAFSAADFLAGTSALFDTRRALLEAGLSRADEWDVYFQVFSVADRVSHMLFADFDPQHPAHDAAHAAQLVDAFGARFPLSDAIPQAYCALDRLVGAVMQRVERGEFGPDALLLVASDHGFQSFRRGVNLNNLLHEAGFLVFRDGADGAPMDLAAASQQNLLGYVDWSKTRAYSIGLGKIFLNLEGREPTGIVRADEVHALVADIQHALLAARDADGAPLLSALASRDALFSGPWVHENPRAVYRVAHARRTLPWDGFADLFAGFAPGYRVSWNNTLGGLDPSAVTDNLNNWSGGHVSIDPAHVPGVLFSSRTLELGDHAPELRDIGPTILARYGLDPSATPMEGVALHPAGR